MNIQKFSIDFHTQITDHLQNALDSSSDRKISV